MYCSINCDYYASSLSVILLLLFQYDYYYLTSLINLPQQESTTKRPLTDVHTIHNE